jgi:hypothetical protein
MAVYVDGLRPVARVVRRHPEGTLWCHMIADSEEELHRVAEEIGLRRNWYHRDHYDLTEVRS